MPPPQDKAKSAAPEDNSLGAIFTRVAGALREVAPQAGTFTIGILLRRLAGEKECLTAMARVMAEDAGQEWEKIARKDKRELLYQARAALAGLHAYLTKRDKDPGD